MNQQQRVSAGSGPMANNVSSIGSFDSSTRTEMSFMPRTQQRGLDQQAGTTSSTAGFVTSNTAQWGTRHSSDDITQPRDANHTSTDQQYQDAGMPPPAAAPVARRRLDLSGTAVGQPVNPSIASVDRLRCDSQLGSEVPPSTSRLGSDMPARSTSRLTAKAIARASVRDSGSEQSSKLVKDVYRDDRGRRVERPKAVNAHMHMIGELLGASGFPRCHQALFCRYRLVYDGYKSWAVAQGHETGCTQVSSALWSDHNDGLVAWEHPLDVHMTMQRLEGWPRLLLMVFARDDAACKDLFVSYAVCPLPNTAGAHSLELRTWYPVDARTSKHNGRHTFAKYLGMAPRLDDDLTDLGFVTDIAAREEAGPYISSVGSGCVHLRLQMLFRNMAGLTRQLHDKLYKSLESFQVNLVSQEEGERRRAANRQAALEEYQAEQRPSRMSEGLRQLREGRMARFEAAQQRLLEKHDHHAFEKKTTHRHTPSVDSMDAGRLRSPDGMRLSPAGREYRGGFQSAPRGRPAEVGSPMSPASRAKVASSNLGRRSTTEPGVTSPVAGRMPSNLGPGAEDGTLASRQAERDRRRAVASLARR